MAHFGCIRNSHLDCVRDTCNINEPHHKKICLMPFANNKGADKPARMRSLIKTFVVRCLDRLSVIPILAFPKLSRL